MFDAIWFLLVNIFLGVCQIGCGYTDYTQYHADCHHDFVQTTVCNPVCSFTNLLKKPKHVAKYSEFNTL